MDVIKTPIAGVLLIKPLVRRDSRGYFVETWQKRRYEEAGIELPFVQDNRSLSQKNTLRGMHFQIRHPQGKLVSCPLGSVYDVACDIRPNSPTYGQWYGVELNEENQWQLWIAPGLAHGFAVLSDCALFEYKCTDYYQPGDEGAFVWNDPFFNISWPVVTPTLSHKDATAPCWKPEKA